MRIKHCFLAATLLATGALALADDPPKERPITGEDPPKESPTPTGPQESPPMEGEPQESPTAEGPAKDPAKKIPTTEGEPTKKEDTQTKSPMTEDRDKPPMDKGAQKSADVPKPKLDTAQVVKLGRDAMTHIAAAERALAQNDNAAAKAALERGEKALVKLYKTPAIETIVDELDEAIRTVQIDKERVKTLDLAPISARLRSYQSYMDPAIAAGIEQARERASQDDAEGTESALRMVRDRVAVDLALLPVEDAYVRVLAAQQALADKDARTARRLLRNVPIVVSEVQISRPLVPIRFKLHAAAEAAEAGKWQRAQQLVREVNQDMQGLESTAMDSKLKSELAAIGDEVEQLSKHMQEGTKPEPAKIREIATRTRSLVEEDRG